MGIKIFNLYQSNKFIDLGARVVHCGISRGKFYIEFEEDDIFKDLMYKWNTRTLN